MWPLGYQNCLSLVYLVGVVEVSVAPLEKVELRVVQGWVLIQTSVLSAQKTTPVGGKRFSMRIKY